MHPKSALVGHARWLVNRSGERNRKLKQRVPGFVLACLQLLYFGLPPRSCPDRPSRGAITTHRPTAQAT